MGITLRVPGSLKTWLGGSEEADCEGATVRECIQYVVQQYPSSRQRLLNDEGEVSGLLLIFLNGQSIRELGGLAAPVMEGDQLAIIPLAAGG